MKNDNEIIKALECCSKGDKCWECPYEPKKHNKSTYGCSMEMMKENVDLINRLNTQNKEFDEKIVMQKGLIDWQKAEIERLQKENEELGKVITSACELNCFLEVTRKCVRDEAIKELVEKVKQSFCPDCDYDKQQIESAVDNVLKQMESENNV